MLSDFRNKISNKESNMDWLDLFRSRVSETLANIDEEKSLLTHNLVYLGLDLCEFFRLLLEVFGSETERVNLSYVTSMFLSTLDLTRTELTDNPDDKRIDYLLKSWNAFFSSNRILRKYEFFV